MKILKAIMVAFVLLSSAANIQAQTTINFNFTGSSDTWIVPAGVTSITIEAQGAEGGSDAGSAFLGGVGAVLTGTIVVTPGEVLNILVGGQGTRNGGGGGSFVVRGASTPLIVAGGGGGSCNNNNPNKDGQIGNNGGNSGAIFGGIGGAGGSCDPAWSSGGGAGLIGDGSICRSATIPALSYVNGGTGGAVPSFGIGGFGGGGAGSGVNSGGGGGGYSGGAGGGQMCGGGGGSFNAGTDQMAVLGTRSGNGFVSISYDEHIAIPTMSEWGLIFFVLLLMNLGLVVLRQRSIALS